MRFILEELQAGDVHHHDEAESAKKMEKGRGFAMRKIVVCSHREAK